MFRQKNLSQDFITKIIDKSAGRVPQNILEDFFANLEKEINLHHFTKTSESNLLRIIQNQFDLLFFINECLRYPHQIDILIIISINSNYLSDILVRNPEYFHWIINPSVLESKVNQKYYRKELEKSIFPFKSFESKVNAIRFFKRKEILRIGLKDIYLKEDLKSITQHLSDLAKSISSVLFELCYKTTLMKYGIEKISGKYVLISLGKLGGNELNYSSDIDLVAFYEKNIFIKKTIFYNQILTEAILLFIEAASKITGAGFLYRVDFRLRPDGRNSPLCTSYAEIIKYYESRGEDWERQMLIKANFVCGKKILYNQFSNYVSNFIYPASFSVSPTDQIKKMKSNIEKRNKSDENIKLVSGGIRDIEFSVQALQLLNGGKDSEIRTSNTLNSIEKLSRKNILLTTEANDLSSAYIFYRKAEHYLQLMNDQQTHSIPSEGELAEKLSHFLGFKNLDLFNKHLNASKQKVKTIYNSIVTDDKNLTSSSYIDEIHFADIKRAKRNLDFLQFGKSLFAVKQFDKTTTSSYEIIEKELFKFLAVSVDPDIVVENFTRFIRNAIFPHIWFKEFIDKNFFDLFLNLCERSQKAIELFSEDKNLRDTFLSRECLIQLNQENIFNLSLKEFHFRTSVQLTANIINADSFSSLYSEYLNQNLTKIINAFIKDKKWANNFFVAAMGSFGASELTFNSDIDLLFIVSGILNYPGIQKDFQDLLKIIRNSFPGIEIDCRLRPEGKSSLLVWDIENYKKYFVNRARVWELQAFTKCKFIAGNRKLHKKFYTYFTNAVKTKDRLSIKKEMLAMNKKIHSAENDFIDLKNSTGGLTDIDFIVSYLLLTNPKLLIELDSNRDRNRFYTLKEISSKPINIKALEENFLFLKNTEIMNQNIFNSKTSLISSDEIKLFIISKSLGIINYQTFSQRLNELFKQTKNDFQKIFN
ncbi:MAG TPA: hypothetical protein DHV28_02750 [Ignavibacteriales bacterium]|nr:hypothetical protein [Ignavibacteriales bacterium]